jgi:hypothetical protein
MNEMEPELATMLRRESSISWPNLFCLWPVRVCASCGWRRIFFFFLHRLSFAYFSLQVVLVSSFLVSSSLFRIIFVVLGKGASSAPSIYFMKSRWRVVVTFPPFLCVSSAVLSGRRGEVVVVVVSPAAARILPLFIRCICRSKPSCSRSQNCSLHRIPAISQRENHFRLLVPFCQVPSGASYV